MVLRREADFGVAVRLRGRGVPLGELFAFLSGLYFRGKLAYASLFAAPPPQSPGVLIITPCSGLKEPGHIVTAEDVVKFSKAEIGKREAAYTEPLLTDAKRLAASIGRDTDIVLLGSIATGKYLDILVGCFGGRLRFPEAFVGRGDMSRGGLMLRSVAAGEELRYIPAEGALLHGRKPPKLEPMKPLTAKAKAQRKRKRES